MNLWSGLGRVLAMASLVVLATGCGPVSGSSVSHEDDPDFARGKNRLARKDLAGAILSFEQAIANNPANAAAHFELALIFYSPSSGEKTDYVAACYHFNRHIALQPDSKHADNIDGFVKVCKKEIAKDIAMAPIPPSEINAIHSLRTQLAKANAENSSLKGQVEMMRGRLNQVGSETANIAVATPEPPLPGTLPPVPGAGARSPSAGIPTRPSYPSATPAGNSGRTHKLQQGENLYAVARRFGIPFAQLKAANPRLMRNSRDLKPGVTVYIPAKRN
ncbi:MAG: LysM peptidoglycan-binding domain-containing protein [Limisphaerales bacterium]